MACHRNIPNIHIHEKRSNTEGWRGAELQVTIEGNWTTYRVSMYFEMKLTCKLFNVHCSRFMNDQYHIVWL